MTLDDFHHLMRVNLMCISLSFFITSILCSMSYDLTDLAKVVTGHLNDLTLLAKFVNECFHIFMFFNLLYERLFPLINMLSVASSFNLHYYVASIPLQDAYK